MSDRQEREWRKEPPAPVETKLALARAISEMEIDLTKAMVAKRDLIWLGYWQDYTDAYLETKIVRLRRMIAYLTDLLEVIDAEAPTLVGWRRG